MQFYAKKKGHKHNFIQAEIKVHCDAGRDNSAVNIPVGESECRLSLTND